MSKLKGILCASAVGMAVFLSLAVSAQAVSECDDIVFDGAGGFKDPGTVVASARRLAGNGADVHAVLIKSFGDSGNLDRYEKEVEGRCSSWQSPTGRRKNNLIVVMVSVNERKAGLYAGSMYSLKDQWPRIEQELMKPHFRDGDLDATFIAALDEVARVTQAALHPPLQQERPVVVVSPQPAAAPMDLSWLGSVFEWGLVVVVLLFLLYFGSKWMNDRNASTGKRRTAQLKAKGSKNACSSAIDELKDQVALFVAKLQSSSKNLSDEDAQDAQTVAAQVNQAYQQATIDFAEVNRSNDPDRDGLTEGEYLQMAENCEVVRASISDVRKLMQSYEAKVASIANFPQAVAASKQRLEEVKKATPAAAALLQSLSHEYPASAIQPIADNCTRASQCVKAAAECVDAADVASKAKPIQLKRGADSLEQASSLLDQATDLLNAIPARKRELERAKQQAATALQQAAASLAAANPTDPEFSSEFAAASVLIQQAQSELATKQPDFAKVIALSGQAADIIANIARKRQELVEQRYAERHREESRRYRGSDGDSNIVILNSTTYNEERVSRRERYNDDDDDNRSPGVVKQDSDNDGTGGSSSLDASDDSAEEETGGSSSLDASNDEPEETGGSTDL